MILGQTMPRFAILIAGLTLSGCGGGGGGSEGGNVTSSRDTNDTTPTVVAAVEVTDPTYVDLADRTSTGTIALDYTALNNGSLAKGFAGNLDYQTGNISGGVLAGADLDGAEFTNPANGEFSRVVSTSSPGNIFGVVGIETRGSDVPLPEVGTVRYNEGWVGVTATTDSQVYVLQGNASFDANWMTDQVNGQFTGLSGRDSLDRVVSNIGNITLTGATIDGSGKEFSGGRVTGTGVFATLDDNLNGSELSGQFFGPGADELGGVIDVDDADSGISVTGAFQAD